MNALAIEDHFSYACVCSLVNERGSAEGCGTERAASCVMFLIKTLLLAQKTFPLLYNVESWNE